MKYKVGDKIRYTSAFSRGVQILTIQKITKYIISDTPKLKLWCRFNGPSSMLQWIDSGSSKIEPIVVYRGTLVERIKLL